MDPEYGQHYRQLFERHWWWRSRESVIVDELQRARPTADWGAILDVGCGDGLFFPRLSQMGDVEGVEPDERLLSPHRDGDPTIHRVPFDDRFEPGRRYDLILMLDVLEHLEHPSAALRSAARLLQPDGTLLITVPAFRILWTRHDVLNHHRTRYTRRSLQEATAGTGLTIVRMRYFFRWLFLAKLAQRLTEAVTPGDPKPPEIPPAWINRLLIWLCRQDQRLLGALRLQFGSSLLALATRT